MKFRYDLALDLLDLPEVNPSMPNMNGSNALHILFANFSDDPRAEALVIRLIKAGVDVNHLDDNWLAPIHIAIKKNHIGAV